MFGLSWAELMVIGVVALIVIGPRDLPEAFRSLGRGIGAIRQMARDVQGFAADFLRESEIDALRRDVETSFEADLGDRDRAAPERAPPPEASTTSCPTDREAAKEASKPAPLEKADS